MPRVDLCVRFREREIVKRLGARWDSRKRVWYVPPGLHLDSFTRWLPRKLSENCAPTVRSDYFWIAASCQVCWNCRRPTRVWSFALPASAEYLYSEVDPNDHNSILETWEYSEMESVLADVTWLNDAALTALSNHTEDYFIDFSQTSATHYYMNHCELCDAKQGDHYIYNEPYGAYFPEWFGDTHQIDLYSCRRTSKNAKTYRQ